MAKNRHKLLIIEDNEINREIICEILKDDYDLLLAENGKIGMDLLSQDSEIDAIITDIHMPVMDGYEVLKAVNSDPIFQSIPIVVTTTDDEEHKCLQLGASDFIRKPYDPTIVRLRVDSIIRLLDSTRSDALKTRFIQNMSHEIRTPLNAIMGFSQMLGMPSDMLDDTERTEYASYISDNVEMLLRMVEDMIALSDISNRMFSLVKEQVSLNSACKKALACVDHTIPEGVKSSFTSDLPDSLQVFTDGKRIEQILINYLTNACKFTSEGEIRLHCSKEEKPGYITISVTDTGIGIPADKAEYIFGRFNKLDSFTQGNGLGLSIVRQIANYLGGQAYLDTTYTSGARFVFELPIDQTK